MWSRLDDELMDHRKIFLAGSQLGSDGPAIALGLYVVGLMWANKHLSDGKLPRDVVLKFSHVISPLKVAKKLVKAGLWDADGRDFVIHDFTEFGNPTAETVRAKRVKDRRRKRAERAKVEKTGGTVHEMSTRTRDGHAQDTRRTRQGQR